MKTESMSQPMAQRHLAQAEPTGLKHKRHRPPARLTAVRAIAIAKIGCTCKRLLAVAELPLLLPLVTIILGGISRGYQHQIYNPGYPPNTGYQP